MWAYLFPLVLGSVLTIAGIAILLYIDLRKDSRAGAAVFEVARTATWCVVLGLILLGAIGVARIVIVAMNEVKATHAIPCK
jgi:hypothetical protein